MKNIRRLLLALLLAAVMIFAASGALAAGNSISMEGTYAARLGDQVFASVYNGTGYTLYSVPAEGGTMTPVESASAIDDLLVVNNYLYYLRSNGSQYEIVKRSAAGSAVMLSEFEVGVELSHLSWYDDVLYCLANDRIYIVDANNGDSTELCDISVDDYVIVSDVIFFISGDDTVTYERLVTGSDQPLSMTAGKVYSMSILGTNPEVLVPKGATDLRAKNDNIYFHNLEDNYVMGSQNDMWLEGKLYRYNIQTGQLASLNLDYDWDYYPTDAGLVVYTSQDISLYPLTGGAPVQLMAPELRTSVAAYGDDAYVYEYNSQRFTDLPLDGTMETVLSNESDILPDEGQDEDPVVVVSPIANGNESDYDDDTDDDIDTGAAVVSNDPNSYIFPNSSTEKLTRTEILSIDSSLWGYARNEIYARHGYVFKNSDYKDYFEGKNWYTAGGFSTSQLNAVEWYNMDLIKTIEQENGSASSGSSVSSSGTKSKGNSKAKNNYYVLKEARNKKLSKKYLRKKLGSKSKYALARNEILARHGYVFKTAKYRKYFNNQKWYKPGGYSSSKVSAIEWYNIKQLKALEAE